MLRIYKKNSLEIGAYTASNNLVNFQDDVQSGDAVDMKNSYYQLNTSVTAGANANLPAGCVKLYSLGTNVTDKWGRMFVPYSPSALVMNSKLSSQNYNVGKGGLLESNLKINLMKETLNKLQHDEESRLSSDYYSGTPSLDKSIQLPSETVFPFTNIVRLGANNSTYKSNNLILPIGDVLPSFGDKVLPAWVGSLKHNLALENRKNIFGEVNPLSLLPNTQSRRDFLYFDDKTVDTVTDPNDARKITISGIDKNSVLYKLASNKFVNGLVVGLTFNNGLVATSRVCTLDGANGITFANGNMTLLFGAGQTGFANNDDITDGRIHLNILRFADLGADGAVLTTAGLAFGDDATVNRSSSLYVGMPLKIYGLETVSGDYESNFRKVVSIARNGNNLELTLDVAILASTLLFATYDDCFDGIETALKPTFSIDEAELVSWHIQGIKKEPLAPIIYNRYDLLAENRPVSSQYQKSYVLPKGVQVKNVMLVNEITSDSNLECRDDYLSDYRMSFDNTPTTSQNVSINSPMFYDRLYKGLGGSLNTLNSGVPLIVENNNTANNSPILDVLLNASSGQNLSQNSIANLYVKSVTILEPPQMMK